MVRRRKTLAEMAKDAAPGDVERDLDAAQAKMAARDAEIRYKDALAQIEGLQRQVDVFTNLPAPKPRKVRKGKARPDGNAAALLVLSDWHAEERVDPETINNKNAYDLDVFRRRAAIVFQKALRFLKVGRALSDIDEFVVVILGDLISGYIHDESEAVNFCGPLEAITIVGDVLSGGIEHLYKNIKVDRFRVTASYGNHGRITTKPRAATAYSTNLEWVMYSHIAAVHRNSHPAIEWQIAKGYHNLVDVKGHMVRCHHGDSIRYYGGVGGLSIPVNKAVAQWNASTTPASLDIFGHFHQFQWNDYDNWVSSGSLMGYNAYATKIKAKLKPPSQAMVFIDQQKGVVDVKQIFVEE